MKRIALLILALATLPALAAKPKPIALAPVPQATATNGSLTAAPAATLWQANLSGTDTACTSTAPCTVSLYRQTGACPSGTISTTGWTTITQPNTTSLLVPDKTVVYGATYCYSMTVAQGGYTSLPSSGAQVAIPALIAAPTSVQAASSGSTATVTWTPATGQLGVVYRAAQSCGTATATAAIWTQVNLSPASSPTLVDTNLPPGTYCYGVEAVQTVSTGTSTTAQANSGLSTLAQVTIANPPPAPTVVATVQAQ